MVKNDKKLLLVAQEIKLVKILAGNNKKLRDRTIKRLSKWLTDRSNSAPLTEDALLRIWKGLFYAMWMSDKPLIQEDCSEKIANLIHLNDVKTSLLFFKCFLQTMLNEWYGIDQHRIDKFCMLIRRVLRQMFEVLHQNNWEDENIKEFREILNQTALKINRNTALGLCLHIDDIFLEELAKVSKGNIDSSKILELIQPFVQQLARVDDKRQTQHIINHIFKHLINQTDAAIDYKEKFHAWKRQGFPGRSIDAMECVESEEKLEESIEDKLDELPKDPRAGKVDVILPQLKFDPLQVINLLEEIKFKKYTTSSGRKAITKLIKQFKLLSEGIYPLGLTKIEYDDDKATSLKKSVKRLQSFENNLKHDSKKTKQKALKHKKAQEILFKYLEKDDSPNNKQIEQKKAKTIEEFIEKSEGHILNKVQPKKRKTKLQTEKNTPIKPNLEPEKQIPIKAQNYFKRNSGLWTVDEFDVSDTSTSDWEKPLQDGETEIFVVSKKSKKKLKRLAETKNRPITEIVNDFTKKIMKTPKNSSIVKNPFSTPKSEKKIKFSNEIQAQELRDHEKKVISSPVPYDANKQPKKSLLKPSPFNSPVNPFYKI